VVGAYQEDEDASGANTLGNAGSAYIFYKDQGGTDNWGQVKKIVASDRATNDYFGYSVSINGNIVVVGAYQEDEDASGANTTSNAGSAYIFYKDQGGVDNWGQAKKLWQTIEELMIILDIA
jgi:spore coat protein U-like protein